MVPRGFEPNDNADYESGAFTSYAKGPKDKNAVFLVRDGLHYLVVLSSGPAVSCIAQPLLDPSCVRTF